MKYCKDCKHCRKFASVIYNCEHPDLRNVIGDPMNCIRVRAGKCGQEAKFFEPKEKPDEYGIYR